LPLFASLLIIIYTQYVSSAQDKKLSFSQVYMFGGPRILAPLPKIQGWLDENNYVLHKREGNINKLLKVWAESGEEVPLIDYSAINENLKDFNLSADQQIGLTSNYSGLLFNIHNDLFFYFINTNRLERLTNNEEEEKNPTLSPDGQWAAFTRKGNLFVINVETGKETQLTKDTAEYIYNGYASWVYMEEIIGRSEKYRAFWWAPNSEMIAFLCFDDSPVPKFPLYNTSDVHGEIEWGYYPKAGDPNPKVKLGIAHLTDKNIVWAEEDESIDQYTAWPIWSPESKELFYQVLNRGQDHLKIFSANPRTGKNRLVYEEKQQSWVDFFEDIYILKNNRGFILRSDIDEWRHLYYFDMNGALIAKLSGGEWNVSRLVLVDEENEKVYFAGNKDDMLNTYLFIVDFDGKNLKRLTNIQGTHQTSVSPGGRYFYSSYSDLNTPAKLGLFDASGNLLRILGERKTALFDDYNLSKAETFFIETIDGLRLPAMWILPPNFDSKKKYPVLFSVYGGPGGKDVSNSFPHYLDKYFMSQNGVIYFAIDHRGSAYFGGRGKSYLHRNLGKWEIEDYSAGAQWLKSKPFVDSTKIGITGSSYGGYAVCMALTLGADFFTHGLAEYSVTDWRLYDNVYTERYMDKPEENPEGYNFGSAMTHAYKYTGLLRLTHGIMDDNVHMQNTIQLVDKLTMLNKKFELMLYPNERHGVGFSKRKHEQREYVDFWFRNLLNINFNVE
jgi:dipeptidyl-peptidase-4